MTRRAAPPIRYRLIWHDGLVERERVIVGRPRIARHPATGLVLVNGQPFARVRLEQIGPEPPAGAAPPGLARGLDGGPAPAGGAMLVHLRAALAEARRRARLAGSQRRRSVAGGSEAGRRRRGAARARSAPLLALAREVAQALGAAPDSRPVVREVAARCGLPAAVVRGRLRRALAR